MSCGSTRERFRAPGRRQRPTPREGEPAREDRAQGTGTEGNGLNDPPRHPRHQNNHGNGERNGRPASSRCGNRPTNGSGARTRRLLLRAGKPGNRVWATRSLCRAKAGRKTPGSRRRNAPTPPLRSLDVCGRHADLPLRPLRSDPFRLPSFLRLRSSFRRCCRLRTRCGARPKRFSRRARTTKPTLAFSA